MRIGSNPVLTAKHINSSTHTEDDGLSKIQFRHAGSRMLENVFKYSQVAFWKAQHLPGLRLTANGTQNDKAEAGSIPVLTTKEDKMRSNLRGLQSHYAPLAPLAHSVRATDS